MLTTNLEPTQDDKDSVDSTMSDGVQDDEDPVDSTIRDGVHVYSEGSSSVALSNHDWYSDVFNDDINLSTDEESTLTLAAQKKVIKRDAAKFILTLKEIYKPTQASLNYAIKAVDNLMFLSSKMAERSLAEGDQGQYSSLFDDLQTEYLQTKYFKENFGLIVSVVFMYILIQTIPSTQEPIACELGATFRYQQIGAKGRLSEVIKMSHYVPLLDILEQLLNKNVFQEVYLLKTFM